MQSAGPFNEKLKPFSQLFPPSGQNISCMLIFTGQRWPHRAVNVLAHSQSQKWLRFILQMSFYTKWCHLGFLCCTCFVPSYLQFLQNGISFVQSSLCLPPEGFLKIKSGNKSHFWWGHNFYIRFCWKRAQLLLLLIRQLQPAILINACVQMYINVWNKVAVLMCEIDCSSDSKASWKALCVSQQA